VERVGITNGRQLNWARGLQCNPHGKKDQKIDQVRRCQRPPYPFKGKGRKGFLDVAKGETSHRKTGKRRGLEFIEQKRTLPSGLKEEKKCKRASKPTDMIAFL